MGKAYEVCGWEYENCVSSLNTAFRHGAKFVVTGVTVCCRYDTSRLPVAVNMAYLYIAETNNHTNPSRQLSPLIHSYRVFTLDFDITFGRHDASAHGDSFFLFNRLFNKKQTSQLFIPGSLWGESAGDR